MRRVEAVEQERALAVATGSTGGYAVPFQLDPEHRLDERRPDEPVARVGHRLDHQLERVEGDHLGRPHGGLPGGGSRSRGRLADARSAVDHPGAGGELRAVQHRARHGLGLDRAGAEPAVQRRQGRPRSVEVHDRCGPRLDRAAGFPDRDDQCGDHCWYRCACWRFGPERRGATNVSPAARTRTGCSCGFGARRSSSAAVCSRACTSSSAETRTASGRAGCPTSPICPRTSASSPASRPCRGRSHWRS
jgi:hypothetical protein